MFIDDTIKQKINTAISLLQQANIDIKQIPELDQIHRLIAACEKLDAFYAQRWCEEYDFNDGVEVGTTYKEGANMELYIESSDWHDVSVALRELRPLTGYPDPSIIEE